MRAELRASRSAPQSNTLGTRMLGQNGPDQGSAAAGHVDGTPKRPAEGPRGIPCFDLRVATKLGLIGAAGLILGGVGWWWVWPRSEYVRTAVGSWSSQSRYHAAMLAPVRESLANNIPITWRHRSSRLRLLQPQDPHCAGRRLRELPRHHPGHAADPEGADLDHGVLSGLPLRSPQPASAGGDLRHRPTSHSRHGVPGHAGPAIHIGGLQPDCSICHRRAVSGAVWPGCRATQHSSVMCKSDRLLSSHGMLVMFNVTKPYGEGEHAMTKGQPKLTGLDLKSLLASGGDFLRTMMDAAVQAVLEAEMTEALSAEKSARVTAARATAAATIAARWSLGSARWNCGFRETARACSRPRCSSVASARRRRWSARWRRCMCRVYRRARSRK